MTRESIVDRRRFVGWLGTLAAGSALALAGCSPAAGTATPASDQNVGTSAASSVTAVFDFAHFGESEGEPRQLEDPTEKASDISAAVSYVAELEFVDPGRIGAMGICGSGSYVTLAAANDERIRAVVSLVPGATTLDSMMMKPLEQARADREAWEAGSEPAYIDLMPRAFADGAAYYYNPERNTAANWSNLAVSWSEESWVGFDARENVKRFDVPYLVITGQNAWSRPVAEALYDASVSERKSFHLVDGAGHFDLYDLEPYVSEAIEEIVPFFGETL